MEELKQKWEEYVQYTNNYLDIIHATGHIREIALKEMLTFSMFMEWVN